MATLSDRLRWRDEDGDSILSAELLARIQGTEPIGRPLPVDLEELADVMASYGDVSGGYLDLDTGQVLLASMVSARGIDLEDGDEELGIEADHRWVEVDAAPRRSRPRTGAASSVTSNPADARRSEPPRARCRRP